MPNWRARPIGNRSRVVIPRWINSFLAGDRRRAKPVGVSRESAPAHQRSLFTSFAGRNGIIRLYPAHVLTVHLGGACNMFGRRCTYRYIPLRILSTRATCTASGRSARSEAAARDCRTTRCSFGYRRALRRFIAMRPRDLRDSRGRELFHRRIRDARGIADIAGEGEK